MNKRQFEEITKWQTETFGHATALSKIAHLQEEISELSGAIGLELHDRRLEFADCFILLFGAASSDGMTYQQILEAMKKRCSLTIEENGDMLKKTELFITLNN